MSCSQAERGHNAADISVVTIALVLQILVLLFGYITWGQFGWRTYSKLAADMRIKNADEQRTSFVLVNCFMTLLKLDVQVRSQSCPCGRKHNDKVHGRWSMQRDLKQKGLFICYAYSESSSPAHKERK